MITNCGLGIHTDKPLPKRRDQDHYPTDMGTVHRVLERYQDQQGLFTKWWQEPRYILDPGAGSGNWGRGCRHFFPDAVLAGCDIRETVVPEGYHFWNTGDFRELYTGWKHGFDLICGNPPYVLAEEFVRHGLSLLNPGGYMIYLLRLAFLEGQHRRDNLFREFPPLACWVCSKRPSFQADGRTNATAFAAFVWKHDYWGATALSWLR